MARTRKAAGIRIPWSVVIAISLCMSTMSKENAQRFMGEFMHALARTGSTP